VTTPGRRSALTALAVVAPLPSIGAAMALWIAPGPTGSFLYGLLKAAFYGLPLVWLLRVDRGRLSASSARKGGFGVGALLGVAIGLLLYGSYLGFAGDWLDGDRIREAAGQNGFDTPARYLALCAYICLLNSLLEEYAFRWFLFTRCRALLAPGAAVVAAGLLFTAHHVVVLRRYMDWGPTLAAAAGVFVGGIAWSWCYHRYESVWPGWVSHVIADVAIMAIGAQVLFGGP